MVRSAIGEEHGIEDKTYSLSISFYQNTIDKMYLWISEPTNGSKYLVKGKKLFVYQRMDERGGLFREKVKLPDGKNSLQMKL